MACGPAVLSRVRWLGTLCALLAAHAQIIVVPPSNEFSCTDSCQSKNAICDSKASSRATSLSAIALMASKATFVNASVQPVCTAAITSDIRLGDLATYAPYVEIGATDANGSKAEDICVYASAPSWCDAKSVSENRQRLCPCSCGAGSFTRENVFGSFCDTCPTNTSSMDEWVECCSDQGWHYNTTLSICTACKPGKYQKNGASTHCIDCAPGQYSDTNGTSTCTACPINTYADVTGLEVCKQCPFAKLQHSLGSQTIYDCVECDLGSLSKKSVQGCVECAAGQFSNNFSDVNCTFCQPGSISGTGKTFCTPCPFGNYEILNGTACGICPPGTVCKSGIMSVDAGYFTWEPVVTSETVLVSCPNFERCNASGLKTVCTDGYAGALCLFCNTETHAFHAGDCQSCEGVEFLGDFFYIAAFGFVAVVVLLVIIVSCCALCFRRSKKKANALIAKQEEARFIQAKKMPSIPPAFNITRVEVKPSPSGSDESLSANLKSPIRTDKTEAFEDESADEEPGSLTKWTPSASSSTGPRVSICYRALVYADVETVKILIMHLQVSMCLFDRLSIPWSSMVRQLFQTLSVLNGDVLETISAGCMIKSNAFVRLEFALFIPASLTVISVFGGVFSNCANCVCRKDDRNSANTIAFLRLCMGQLYFFYVLVVYRAVLTFDCVSITNLPPGPKTYLAPEEGIECDAEWSQYVMRALIVLGVYGVMLPLALALALRHYRSVLRTQFYVQAKTPCYSTPCMKDEIICFLPQGQTRCTIEATPTLIESASGTTCVWLKFAPENANYERRDCVWVLLADHHGDMPTLIQNNDPWVDAVYGWLYAGFEPQYWLWEVFNFAWKFIMCGCIPLVFPTSVTQIVCAIFVAVLHLLILGVYEPYSNKSNTNVSIFLQTLLVFVLSFGVLLRTHVDMWGNLLMSPLEMDALSFLAGLAPVAFVILCCVVIGLFNCWAKFAPVIQQTCCPYFDPDEVEILTKTSPRQSIEHNSDSDSNSDDLWGGNAFDISDVSGKQSAPEDLAPKKASRSSRRTRVHDSSSDSDDVWGGNAFDVDDDYDPDDEADRSL